MKQAASPTGPVVGFGELLMRLDTADHRRLVEPRTFLPSFTGGEANAAVALAQWGVPTSIVSRVPDHALGQAAVNALRAFGVSTRFVARGGDRLGLLFVEHGASQRGTRVIYDRLHTSLRTATPAEFEWHRILDGASWLHLTGTLPALGAGVVAILETALDVAGEYGVRVSFDCSYRQALWPNREEAGAAFRRVARRADLLFASLRDARTFLGVDASLDPDEAMQALRERFEIDTVVFSRREIESASVNRYEARLADATGIAASRLHRIEIVDRIGAGDALAAGVLLGKHSGWDAERTIAFAAAAAVLAHTVPGDFCLATRDEVAQLALGHTDGSVVR